MIEINSIYKQYGAIKILENISLHLDKGQTFCLLGKNGAGKTTLINIILDIIKADKGNINIFGAPHQQLDKVLKCRIGVVSDNLALIEELNGRDYLKFVGRLYQVPENILQHRMEEILSYFFENQADLQKKIAKYSTGMKKKIAFCAAILHTPDILIMDEPFSALDPLVANQMIAFIKRYQNQERLIFISSHDLAYVEKVSTHIGVLNNQKLEFTGTLADFTENGARQLDAALLQILKPSEVPLDKITWL